MKDNKGIFLQVLFFVVLLLAVVITLHVADEARQAYVGENGAAARIYITDLSGNALEGARVTIVELDKTFTTGKDGKTQVFDVSPLLSARNWEQVTVVVTKAGYVDTVLFGCVVYAENTRTVIIRLYTQDQSGLEYVAYSETAPADYIRSLIKKYKK